MLICARKNDLRLIAVFSDLPGDFDVLAFELVQVRKKIRFGRENDDSEWLIRKWLIQIELDEFCCFVKFNNLSPNSRFGINVLLGFAGRDLRRDRVSLGFLTG